MQKCAQDGFNWEHFILFPVFCFALTHLRFALKITEIWILTGNHNANKQLPKDPASFNNTLLAESTVNALRIRYTILPYIYNELFRVSSKGGSVSKALFFE